MAQLQGLLCRIVLLLVPWAMTTSVLAWNDGLGPISSGYFSIFTLVEDGNTCLWVLNGENQNSISGTFQEMQWTTVDSWLPWTVDILGVPGLCSGGSRDGEKINYSSEILVVNVATICGPQDVGQGNVQGTRCIIPVNP